MSERYENLCQLPLSSDLFTQAIHPTEPVIAVGLSSGHVQTFRLPADKEDEENDSDDEGNTSVLSSTNGTIETQWRTRRHKGSCRSLGYSLDGEVLYSAGTDSLVKAFSSATGIVTSKLHIPLSNGSPDHPTLLHALTPQTLLLATDSSALHVFDLRTPSIFASTKPAQTHRPHDDYISSLTPLPPTAESTSGFSKQWVTTGGTTLAVTDLRRGVLVKSEDQEEELLSSVVVSGFPARGGRSGGQKVVVGSGNGVLTLWERGVWDDQDERVIVTPGGKSGGDSLDAIVVVPGGRREVAVGCGDGRVRLVNLTGKGVLETLRHDELEGVVGVGFDCLGRLISGGGSVVKVWAEKDEDAREEEESEEEEEEEQGAGKRKADSEDDSDDDDSSSEEERQKKKKRRKGKGKDKGVGNGILGFKGLD